MLQESPVVTRARVVCLSSAHTVLPMLISRAPLGGDAQVFNRVGGLVGSPWLSRRVVCSGCVVEVRAVAVAVACSCPFFSAVFGVSSFPSLYSQTPSALLPPPLPQWGNLVFSGEP